MILICFLKIKKLMSDKNVKSDLMKSIKCLSDFTRYIIKIENKILFKKLMTI